MLLQMAKKENVGRNIWRIIKVTVEQIKEVEEQINHLENQKFLLECKDRWTPEDRKCISNIEREIANLKGKLNA